MNDTIEDMGGSSDQPPHRSQGSEKPAGDDSPITIIGRPRLKEHLPGYHPNLRNGCQLRKGLRAATRACAQPMTSQQTTQALARAGDASVSEQVARGGQRRGLSGNDQRAG